MGNRPSEIMGETRLAALQLGDTRRVDAHVGVRLRRRRSMLGISQSKLADALELTFQQVQKYEKGQTRIGVGRLWDISKILGVPITYFFENLDGKVFSSASVPFSPVLAENKESIEADPLARRDVRDLLRAYCSISNPQVAKDILRVIKDLAAADNLEEAESSSKEDN